jgi:peptidoglycan/xylan/chitin deacetylase (PgdA/CDA1 family)
MKKTLQIFIWLLMIFPADNHAQKNSCTYIQGGIVRGDTLKKEMSIVFTGDTFSDGASHIIKVLHKQKVKASFFFTGNFYRDPDNTKYIYKMIKDGHYLGGHSDQHLLYCDWGKRDSLLITKEEFLRDLKANYKAMEQSGIHPEEAGLFLPPYEWYNQKISKWTKEAGFQLVNFTHGTLSNADYTTPSMKNYRSGEEIWQSILKYEQNSSAGLNGFILLVHIGTDPERTDKFYFYLEDLILWLKKNGSQPKRIDELIALPPARLSN